MPISPTLLLQAIVSGVMLGTLYALMAVGLNLIFGVMEVVNIAHGELLMLGGYTTFWLFHLFGLDPILSLLISVPLLFGIGVAIQKGLINRVVGKPPLTTLILTWGISMFMMNQALFFWTSDYRGVAAGYLTRSISIAGIPITSLARLVILTLAVAITTAFLTFLKKTRLGKAIRATAQRRDIAAVCGIDVKSIYLLAYGFGAALAAAGGSLMIIIYAFYPEIGPIYILKCFCIVVLGGAGNLVGALIGSVILGLTEAFASLFITAEVCEGLSYLILLLTLYVRPTGILGKRG